MGSRLVVRCQQGLMVPYLLVFQLESDAPESLVQPVDPSDLLLKSSSSGRHRPFNRLISGSSGVIGHSGTVPSSQTRGAAESVPEGGVVTVSGRSKKYCMRILIKPQLSTDDRPYRHRNRSMKHTRTRGIIQRQGSTDDRRQSLYTSAWEHVLRNKTSLVLWFTA